MVRLEGEGGCQGRGRLTGRGPECSVTALFAQRLNSLRGGAGKCQHGGRLRGVSILSASLKRKAASSSSQPAAPALPEVLSDGRWERRGRAALSHSFIPLSGCRWFMLAMRLLYINTDNAQQRALEGLGRPDATAQEVMSAVSVTEINEWG